MESPTITSVQWRSLTPLPRPASGVSKTHPIFRSEWDGSKVGVVTCNLDEREGRNYLIDGNHRYVRAEGLGLLSEYVTVEQFKNLTPEEVAEIILARQRARREYREADAFELEKQRGDKFALRVAYTVESNGFVFSKKAPGKGQGNPNSITVGCAKNVAAKFGTDILDLLLSGLPGIWPGEMYKTNHVFIGGLAKALWNDVDYGHLIQKLNRVSPGIIESKVVKKYHGRNLAGERVSREEAMYEEIMHQYRSRGIANR